MFVERLNEVPVKHLGDIQGAVEDSNLDSPWIQFWNAFGTGLGQSSQMFLTDACGWLGAGPRQVYQEKSRRDTGFLST